MQEGSAEKRKGEGEGEDEEFGQREGVGRCTEREGVGRMRSLGRGRGWGGAQRGRELGG